MKKIHTLDGKLLSAIAFFKEKVQERYSASAFILFGSYARGTQHAESDVDIMVLLPGEPIRRAETLAFLGGLSIDLVLKTDFVIEAIPLWQTQWENPKTMKNPALVHNIKQDGIFV